MKILVKKAMVVILATIICLSAVSGISVAAAGSLKDGLVPEGITPPSAVSGRVTIMKAGGWLESVYAEWQSFAGASSYKVYYKRSSENDSAFKPVDAQLIRGTRVDIPGLAGGIEHTVKIVPVNSGGEQETSATSFNATPNKHDRSGYAHFNYNEGVGAYNNDGTPKSNALIVYVTDANKNTLTIPGYSNVGIGQILNATGIGSSIVSQITNSRPLIVRIIGTIGTVDQSVNPPVDPESGRNGNIPPKYSKISGLTSFDTSAKENGNMAIVRGAKNFTIEGIGDGARLYGWGLNFKAGESIEVRNLTFQYYPEDALGIEGNVNDANNFEMTRVWVHNNTFEVGRSKACADSEGDKYEGDGSCDIKRGDNFTIAYNVFNGTAKNSLIGGSDSNLTYHVTIHHNWYNKVGSRTPLIRQANLHMYNNYLLGSTGSSISARANSYTLLEANYFENAKKAIAVTSGGVVKSFNNIFTGSSNPDNSTVASTRDQKVTNKNKYPDFDTNSSVFYYDSSNKKSDVSNLTDANTAKAEVMAYSGVMKGNYEEPDIPDVPPPTATVPQLSNGSATRTAATSASVNFRTTANGTLYYIVYEESASEPNAAAIKGGVQVSITGVNEGTATAKSFNISNLSGNTAKKVYMVQVNGISESSVFAVNIPRYTNTPIDPPTGSEKILYPDQSINTENYFSPSSATFNDSARTYNGITYTKAVKLDSNGYVTFSTAGPAEVTFLASGRNANVGKIQISKGAFISGNKTSLQVWNLPANVMTECKYSITESGTYTIQRNDKELGVYYISVDEGESGVTPPVVPQITAIVASRTGEDTASVKFNLNTNGTAYYLISNVNDPIPAKSAIRAGINGGSVSAGERTINVTGLVVDEKRLDLLVETADSLQSNVISLIIPQYVQTGGGSVFSHNFDGRNLTSEFFNFTSINFQSGKNVQANGVVVTTPAKLETNTDISFVTSEPAVITLWFGSDTGTLKFDNVSRNISGGMFTTAISAGTHTIKKQNGDPGLAYILVEYN